MTIPDAIRRLLDLVSFYPRSKAYTWPTEEELEEIVETLQPLTEPEEINTEYANDR